LILLVGSDVALIGLHALVAWYWLYLFWGGTAPFAGVCTCWGSLLRTTLMWAQLLFCMGRTLKLFLVGIVPAGVSWGRCFTSWYWLYLFGHCGLQ
jgi:hypothetical protein